MLKAISNLFERSDVFDMAFVLEKFQTLRLSYNRKPEPCTPDSRGRCKMRKLKPFLLFYFPNYAILISKAPFQANKYGLDRSVSNGI